MFYCHFQVGRQVFPRHPWSYLKCSNLLTTLDFCLPQINPEHKTKERCNDVWDLPESPRKVTRDLLLRLVKREVPETSIWYVTIDDEVAWKETEFLLIERGGNCRKFSFSGKLCIGCSITSALWFWFHGGCFCNSVKCRQLTAMKNNPCF